MITLELIETQTVALSKDKQAFFARLRSRMAELRKARNITQVQLTETVNISRQTINPYEMGPGAFPCFPRRYWPPRSPCRWKNPSVLRNTSRRSATLHPSYIKRSSVFSN